MARPSPEQIADIVLSRRPVYGLDVDSRIRQAANRLTARALFEIVQRLDEDAPDFGSQLSTLLSSIVGEELSYCIGFDTGDIPRGKDAPDTPVPVQEPTVYFLRLVFRNEDAAY